MNVRDVYTHHIHECKRLHIHMRDAIHLHVWRSSFICVIIQTCEYI